MLPSELVTVLLRRAIVEDHVTAVVRASLNICIRSIISNSFRAQTNFLVKTDLILEASPTERRLDKSPFDSIRH